VPFKGAATITGLLAGIAAASLGMGKGGPLVIGKFLLPALGIDLGALLFRRLGQSYLLCALVGALSGATKFFGTIAVDLLTGMDPSIAWRHSLFESFAAMVFGAAGGLCLPPVLRRLRAYGVVQPLISGERA